MTSVDTEIMPGVYPGQSGLGQYTGASQCRLLTLELSQEVRASSECSFVGTSYKGTTNRTNIGKPCQTIQIDKKVVETSLK